MARARNVPSAKVDYQKFLGREETLLLAYLGGASVDAPDRRLRLREPFEPPGWYHFKVVGRVATATSSAERPALTDRPVVRGHFGSGRLVREGAVAEPLYLLPADEPPVLAPVQARRWHSGALLFEELPFETGVEDSARQALAGGLGLHGLKGVPATLRAAFGYELVAAAARRTGVACAPAEARPFIAELADGGPAAADQLLRRLEAEREQARREMTELQRRRQAALATEELRRQRAERTERAQALREADPAAFRQQAQQRAWDALDSAGAQLETCRLLAGDQLEVVFRFMNERFICLCQATTLQVIDSGICLGHPPADRQLTLDSLPSVIKEAIEDDLLVILRHP